MMRLVLPIAAVALATGGCKKSSSSRAEPDPPPRPAVEDAAPAAIDAPPVPGPHPDPLRAELDVDPDEPPPAPIIKEVARGDCSTDYAPRPKRDPNPMCKVTGGTFTMGKVFPDDPDRTKKTSRRVTISPFFIDQLEVTNAQYALFLNAIGTATACPTAEDGRCIELESDDPHREDHLIDRDQGGRFVPAKGYEHHPVTHISFEGALRYCQWAGKDLPTSAQWEYAARYDPKTGATLRYPWGNASPEKRANCAACEHPHDTPWPGQVYPLGEHPPRCIDCSETFEGTSPVGHFDGTGDTLDGSSPFGVLDMLGNVPEWVSDCWPFVIHGGDELEDDFCRGGCRDPVGQAGTCSESGFAAGQDHGTAAKYLDPAVRASLYKSSVWGKGVRCMRRTR